MLLQANPKPPMRPAKASEAISPNILLATITPYYSGFLVSHIIRASILVFRSLIPENKFFWISFASLHINPDVSLITLGFSQTVTDLYPYFFACSNAAISILVVAFLVNIL